MIFNVYLAKRMIFVREHLLLYSWFKAYREKIVYHLKRLCQRLHWGYQASSTRSHQDPCIWSCLGSPQPLLNNITIICFCSSFLPQRSCRGVRRQTAGWAPLPCNQSMRENSQGLVETHAQIDKHTYGVSHTREKKVTTALPPPLLTFLEHLHSLNFLAGVEKTLLCSAPVMFVHWKKQDWF